MITYSTPKKETFKWIIIKYEDDKSPDVLEFNTRKQAYDFLTTITVYIDDKQQYKGISPLRQNKK